MSNKLALLAGIAIGAVLTAGVAQLQAQAPAPATTRNAVFMITEQTITDPKGYAEEYAPKVIPIIKAHGGRYVARTDQVTNLAGDAGPKRIVIIGFEFDRRNQENAEHQGIHRSPANPRSRL